MPLCETVRDLLKHQDTHMTVKLQYTIRGTTDYVKMPWIFWRWSAIPISTTVTNAPVVLAVGAGRFFCPFTCHLSLPKMSSTRCACSRCRTTFFFLFSHSFNRKDQPASALGRVAQSVAPLTQELEFPCSILGPAPGGRVVRWCWVNFQCRGVLQFGFQ